MSRLTTKNRDFWDVEHAQLKDGIPSKWTHSQRIDPLEQALLKLAKIEDFMEDLGIEDLEELKDAMQELLETNNHIKEVSDKYYIYYKEKFNRVLELAEECQTLKDRWEKLKSWIDYCSSGCLEYDEILQKMKELEEEE